MVNMHGCLKTMTFKYGVRILYEYVHFMFHSPFITFTLYDRLFFHNVILEVHHLEMSCEMTILSYEE